MAIKRIGTNVTIENDLVDYLDAFRLALKKPMTREVGSLIVRYVQASVVNHFREQRDSMGMPWRQLADSTRKSRKYLAKKHGWNIQPDKPILIRSGKLLETATRDLTMKIMRGGKGIELYVVPKTKKYRTIFEVHNKPDNEGGREFFYVDDHDKRVIGETVYYAIMGAATRIARSKGWRVKSGRKSMLEAGRGVLSHIGVKNVRSWSVHSGAKMR